MKISVILIVVLIFVTGCTEYSCPTYGNKYVYTPTKKKSFKFSKAKTVKRAEQ